MRLSLRTRVTGILPILLLLASLSASGTLAGTRQAPQPAPAAADLAPALTADGTFTGAPGVAGTIDATAWTLASDLDAGEAPRFVPAGTTVVAAAADTWAALGDNGAGDGALGSEIYALAVSGSDLYVGGDFTNTAGIATADKIAKWDGSAWSALGDNGAGDGALNGPVRALAVSGSDLYVGGTFTDAAGIATADRIAKWDGSAWSGLGDNGAGNGALGGTVQALAVSGSDLYVGGRFTNAAGIATADFVAWWDGSAWSALGDNGAGDGALNSFVYALAVSGTDLYVGGWLGNAAGIATADYVAKWDGSAWSGLGDNGAGDGALSSFVYALAVSGSDLYVGGVFTNAAGIATADYVAKWDGSAWSALGDNGAGDGAITSTVLALAVSGTDVYVGGVFTDAAGIATADIVAKWDGSAWSGLGDNGAGGGALNGTLYALAVSASDLYVGGYFNNAAGIATADYVAAWGLGAAAGDQPDALIRKRRGAVWVGGNIYNSDATGQGRGRTTTPLHTVRFLIRIQNDGTAPDSFSLSVTDPTMTGFVDSATPGYRVRYWHGPTEITAAVVGGSWTSPELAPGEWYRIKARVRVTADAISGSEIRRLLTFSSINDGLAEDAVKFAVYAADIP